MYVSTMLKRKGNQTITIAPDAAVSSVINLLGSHKIGAVMVTDGRGKIRGIISERDIVRGLFEHGQKVMTLTASDLMSRDVVSCRTADTISELMAVMTERNIRHLPVVEAGRLVGMVSMRDVVKERLIEVESDITGLRDYVAGAYVIGEWVGAEQAGYGAHVGQA